MEPLDINYISFRRENATVADDSSVDTLCAVQDSKTFRSLAFSPQFFTMYNSASALEAMVE
jgi:hypothetical protein